MNAYKPSGVKWLSDAPSHWDVQALRTVTQLKSDCNRPELPVLSVYRGEYGIIRKDSRDENHKATSLDSIERRRESDLYKCYTGDPDFMRAFDASISRLLSMQDFERMI